MGLRFSGNDGFGSEISYQQLLQKETRLELDLGIRSGNGWSGWALNGTHQWIFPLATDFNWYLGAGAGLGGYSVDLSNGSSDSKMFVSILGQAGVEYVFPDIPLQISLDTRPNLGLFNTRSSSLVADVSLSVRYLFR